MSSEIERKFSIKKMPSLEGIQPKVYERYFIEIGPREKRIQKVNDRYFYEEKTEVSGLERSRDVKKEITQEEFEHLKQGAKGPIIRERFDVSFSPDISIQIYKGAYEGLVRAEVEFASVEEANKFKPLDWMGSEITDLPISRDSKLIGLDSEDFKNIINGL